MPSKKRQINVRLTPEADERLAQLLISLKAATGIDVTITDVITVALAELEKRYPPEPHKEGKR
jgi:hypothetical protein